jgi:hypothetical protein
MLRIGLPGQRLSAQFAMEHEAQKLLTPAFGQYPGAIGERWIVPHMLGVPAGQIGHPITHLILMKTHNCLFHFIISGSSGSPLA